MTVPAIATVAAMRPIFQVAAGDADVTVGQARYDTSRYDVWPDASYSGLDAEWSDTTCAALEATTWYGRERTIDAFDVGTATVVVENPDGMWDYPPGDGQTTPLTIRPGRQARVGVQFDGQAPQWLWHGWIDATQPGYDAEQAVPTVTISCVCAKGEYGRVELGKVAAVGAGESATARMTRLADAGAVPAHRRMFDQSAVALAGTELGTRMSAEADVTARSAGGDVAGDEAGLLRFFARDWQTRGPGVAPDGAIGNRGLTGEVCPSSWELMFNRSDYTSRVVYGRPADVPPFQLDDVAAQASFGIETWTQTSMLTVDGPTLTDLARRVLRVRGFARAPRVAACTLDAAVPAAAALMASASPFDPSMYACGHMDGDRTVFVRNLYLTGIEHFLTPESWTARLALDDADVWLIPDDTRYDAAHYGTDRYAPRPP